MQSYDFSVLFILHQNEIALSRNILLKIRSGPEFSISGKLKHKGQLIECRIMSELDSKLDAATAIALAV